MWGLINSAPNCNLLKLYCGVASDGSVKFFLPVVEIEEHSLDECKCILKMASKMSHIQSAGVNFDPQIWHSYMALIRKAIMHGIGNGICPEWFAVASGKEVLNKNGTDLAEFRYKESTGLDLHFTTFFFPMVKSRKYKLKSNGCTSHFMPTKRSVILQGLHPVLYLASFWGKEDQKLLQKAFIIQCKKIFILNINTK